MNEKPNSTSPPPPPSDPMFKTLDKTGPLEKAMRKSKSGNGKGFSWVLPTILIICILGLLAYNIYLHNEQSAHQDRLLQLDDNVDATDTRLDQLEEKIYKTEDVLAEEIKKTSKNISELDRQHSRQMAGIKQDMTRKAEKAELASVDMKTDNIKADVGNLKTDITDVDQDVKTVDTKVEEISKTVKKHELTLEEQRELIKGNIHNINANKNILDDTRDSLVNLKTSLDRDYFVFQLFKKSGLIRVSDIGIRLKKTKDKKQEYEVEVFYDDKKMKKKGVANVPIAFYKLGYRKHYELVITKVEKNKVTGYLSTPKVKE